MTAARVRALGSLAALVLAGAGLVACGGDDDSGSGSASGDGDGTTGADSGLSAETTEPGAGGGEAALDDVEVTLTPVASAEAPTALVSRPSSDTLYVAERAGTVRALAVSGQGADRTYELADEPVIDISDDVVVGGGPGDERGLLDITFSPDGGTLYVSYSLDPSGDTRVTAYTMAGEVADPASGREILAVPQPARNHNGGDVEFGPDGYLYVALGDGGGGGDPQGNGQDTDALLGKVLRIDPSAPAGGQEYGIPDGNPFADGGRRARGVALRRAQPVAADLPPRLGRPVGGRRRPGVVGGDRRAARRRRGRRRRQPGLERDGGHAPLRRRQRARGGRRADLRVQPRRGLLDHRRRGLQRHDGAGAGGRLPVHRLLHR